MESSKATSKHIRQVAGDLPVAQIQLMQHQHMELPTRNHYKRKKTTKQKPQAHRTSNVQETFLSPEARKHSPIDVPDVVTQYM